MTRYCSPTPPVCCICVLIFALLAQAVQAAEFEELMCRIPDSANAIIALDVAAIFNSPLAKQEGWREDYANKFAAAPLILPPTANRFLLGAELDIETMHPEWEAASMELSISPSPQEIQTKIGGILDTLVETKVLWPQSGTCIVKFADYQYGILSPANRQDAARWIQRSATQKSDALSPYLRQAVQYAGGAGPEIIMALDLEHIIRPEEIQAAVQRAEILADLDEGEVAAVLSSLRGVTLGVRVADDIKGKLIADFAADASLLEPIAKPLILNIMHNVGASLDECEQWNPEVSGKRVSIAGPLTRDGMRRLFSLVDLDATIVNRKTPAASKSDQPDKSDVSNQEVMASASRRYFQNISKYLNDVQRPSRKKNSLQGKLLWVTNYARKIEKISRHNVDPDMANYADTVVYLMRDAVAQVHGIADRAAERMAAVAPVGDVGVRTVPAMRGVNPRRQAQFQALSFTGVDVGAAGQQQQMIAQEEYQAAIQAGQEIIDQIKSETDAIREKMSSRYGTEF